MTIPILLNSCARAATAAEARFRIDGTPRVPRESRVIGIDPGALAIVGGLAINHWGVLRPADALAGELRTADFVLMVATANDGAAEAAAIGAACRERGIMTAGVVVGDHRDAVNALRPYARVLVVTEDPEDIAEILTVVGA
jgi:hypothetical protein